jgi:hypothetical protein
VKEVTQAEVVKTVVTEYERHGKQIRRYEPVLVDLHA